MHWSHSSVDCTYLTTHLDETVAVLKTLPDDVQERAANVLMAFAQERSTDSLSDDQLVGIDHAMAQADQGQFASVAEIVELFGHRL